MFIKDELRLLWPFYLSMLFVGLLSVASAFIIIYFLEIGMSMFQTSVLFSTAYFASFFFEIPTGAVADTFGRKKSVIISYVLLGVLVMLIPLYDNFYYLFAIFVGVGFAITLSSGADEAWVVGIAKRQDLIEKYYSKMFTIRNLGMVLAPLVGSYIILNFSIRILWFIEGWGAIISALILIKAIPDKISKKRKDTITLSKDALKFSIKDPKISKFLLSSLFFSLVMAGFGILWQPYLKGFDLPIHYFGYLLSGSAIIAVFIPIISNWLSKRFRNPANYLIIQFLILALFLVSAFFINLLVLAIVLIVLILSSLNFIIPIELPIFQRFVPEKMRATVGSVRNMFGTLSSGIAFVFLGGLADLFGVSKTLAMLSVFILPSIFIYSKLRNDISKTSK